MEATKMVDWKTLPKQPYKKLAEISRRVAAEGSVLLKNDGNILPINKEKKVSLFGRTQIDYNKNGTGSGGLVNTEYAVNILDGMLANDDINLNMSLIEVYKDWIKENPFDFGTGWAQEPWCQKEMVSDKELVKSARAVSDVAVVVIGRTAGEDKDNSAEKGSWYLTDEEEALLSVVSEYFEETVVLLNVGNIIDMSWVEKYDIKSVMYIWQGGQEGGNAVADVISGKAIPSGKLTDTIAKHIDFYPSTKNFGGEYFNVHQEDIYVGYRYFETFAKDEVLYPFGFGLSYTEFEQNIKSVTDDGINIKLEIEIKNVGEYCGKEVVQVYFAAPQGKLGKSKKELCGFKKTALLSPGESQTLNIEIPIETMCAYDDSGVTGNKSCYVMESGEYFIYCGNSVSSAKEVYTYVLDGLKIIKRCTQVLAPQKEFDIIYPETTGENVKIAYKKVHTQAEEMKERISRGIPQEIPQTGDKGIKLIDVKNKNNTIEEFVAQLSDVDLRCLAIGEGMCSPKVRPGTAGAVGGSTESLAGFGIPMIAMCDGPSGIRLDNRDKATCLPNGTAIACTWDVEAAEELYENLSIELCVNRVDSLLGPGMNLHRTPLNGRNFEYFSEDPYLTGKIAAALSRGVDKYGNSATIKHFMANTQEYNRRDIDAVASERALREIYLKGYEIAVKEGAVRSIMTSYNPINGVWAPNNYDLNTVILRNEWGYKGIVITDWWPKLSQEDTEVKNLADMVIAQNDVYMVTNDVHSFKDNILEALDNSKIARASLQRNAVNVLNYILKSRAFERFIENGGKLEKSLLESLPELENVFETQDVKSGEKMSVTLEKTGRCLMCIEYSSDRNEIAQMIINTKLNEISAGAITVNGTLGAAKTAYIDLSVTHKENNVEIEFPQELLKIDKIRLYTMK